MSLESVDPLSDAAVTGDALLASAACAVASSTRIRHVRHDLFADDDTRIDEDVRARFLAALQRIVSAVASELIAGAGRILAGGGDPELATALTEGHPPYAMLRDHGLLDDPALVGELLGRAALDAIDDRLPGRTADDADQPSLLARLADHGDRIVAQSARALMTAESRRRDAHASDTDPADLGAEAQHRLVWRIAAALRTRLDLTDPRRAAIVDAALGDAARRSLRAYDEGSRVESAAVRLAAALDPAQGELSVLAIEALDDRRLTLFVALLARGLHIAFDDARDLLIDRQGNRLWVALRAIDCSRADIARIGFVLSEADPRRDLDYLVDRIDGIAAIDPNQASAACTLLRADPEYREAIVRFDRSVQR